MEPEFANEITRVREMANELMKTVGEGSSADRAAVLPRIAEALKVIADIEQSQVETRKLAAEEEKIRYDLKNASKSERLERRQKMVGALAPAVTAFMLVASFAFTTYQFVQSTRDRREAEEKALWSDTLKMVGDITTHSPVATNLSQFIHSKQHADEARRKAIEVLSSTRDPTVFEDLFRIAFEPVQWTNFDEVMRLDRTLGPKLGDLYDQTRKEGTKDGSLTNLTPEEKREYDFFLSAIKVINNAVAPLLKGPRSASQQINLTSTWITDCDWNGVNLSNADIENINLQNTSLKGANLSGITSFNRAYVYGTAWWEATSIDPALLTYLKDQASYEKTKDGLFGPQYVQIPAGEYVKSLARLEGTSK